MSMAGRWLTAYFWTSAYRLAQYAFCRGTCGYLLEVWRGAFFTASRTRDCRPASAASMGAYQGTRRTAGKGDWPFASTWSAAADPCLSGIAHRRKPRTGGIDGGAQGRRTSAGAWRTARGHLLPFAGGPHCQTILPACRVKLCLSSGHALHLPQASHVSNPHPQAGHGLAGGTVRQFAVRMCETAVCRAKFRPIRMADRELKKACRKVVEKVKISRENNL